MERNDLSVRRRTTLAQRLPADHDAKLLEFQQFVIQLHRQHGYDLSQIGNADQTPLTFDLPYERTVAEKGMKTVSIRTTGHEKSHFTVMLACTADGGNLSCHHTSSSNARPFPRECDFHEVSTFEFIRRDGWTRL